MNKIIRKTSNALVTGACAVLGGLHFVAQTSADVVSDAEAKLIRNRDGVDPEHTKKERMYKTIGRQQHILDKVQAFKDTVSQAKDRVIREKTIRLEFTNEEALNNIVLVNAETILSEK
jgi:hypothetical protein